jgi:hypothetical protein
MDMTFSEPMMLDMDNHEKDEDGMNHFSELMGKTRHFMWQVIQDSDDDAPDSDAYGNGGDRHDTQIRPRRIWPSLDID